MKSRLIRIGAFVATIVSMFASATPAQAASHSSALFTGNATTSPLGYPCTPPGSVPGPNCPPLGGGPFGGFTFQSTACLGYKINILSPKTTTASGPSCSITAAGTLQGYCGLASGSGTATLTYFGLGTYTLVANFVLQSVGGTVLLTGTASNNGIFEAVVEAIPNPTSGSCLAGTQNEFIIVGAAGTNSATG